MDRSRPSVRGNLTFFSASSGSNLFELLLKSRAATWDAGTAMARIMREHSES